MIVPFLFSIDERGKDRLTHQWIANKFLYFCFKNKFPIIIEEKFLKDLEKLKKSNHPAFLKRYQDEFEYELLDENQIKKIKKYIISEKEEQEIISNYKNVYNACVNIFSKTDANFEHIIEKKLIKLQNQNEEKIEAIVTWLYYPSLDKVAKKYNIPIIHMELSAIRKPNYRNTLGYFKFGNKYKNKDSFKDYEDFKKEKNFLLNKKEIINLFISDQNIKYINEMDRNSEYEIGIPCGMKKDCYVAAFDGTSNNEIMFKLSKLIPINKISVRPHPAMPLDEKKYKYSFDYSYSSMEWLTKCKNVICTVSNVGYEAILFNKGLISTNDNMITSFGYKSKIEYFDPKYYGIEELNFLTFAYFVPYELMFDVKYIRYRLNEKNIYNIYNYNLNYFLKKYNLNVVNLKKMNYEERFKSILNTHNINRELKDLICYYNFEKNITKEDITNKDKTISDLSNELSNILNSKGWQFLEKLRKIKPGK